MQRSIPACTGNPCSPSIPPWGGLSPRVRGTLWERWDSNPRRRSIPACTGNPPTCGSSTTRTRVYPRVYGEPLSRTRAECLRLGLSPRVRGTHVPDVGAVACLGSIPACTGNPSSRAASETRPWVYPRVYGEPEVVDQTPAQEEGLSPRVRGTLEPRPGEAAGEGSIPACTGNPRPPARAARLSQPSGRSIPACTGNPRWRFLADTNSQVYPRVYGEPPSRTGYRTTSGGLSPRVRGTRRGGGGGGVQEGSIPACTGNPCPAAPSACPPRVYPRVYGEPSVSE